MKCDYSHRQFFGLFCRLNETNVWTGTDKLYHIVTLRRLCQIVPVVQNKKDQIRSSFS